MLKALGLLLFTIFTVTLNAAVPYYEDVRGTNGIVTTVVGPIGGKKIQIDGSLLASKVTLNTASNILRTAFLASDLTTSNGVRNYVLVTSNLLYGLITSGSGTSTNDNQFGVSSKLTIKNGAKLTNTAFFGLTNTGTSEFGGDINSYGIAYFPGGASFNTQPATFLSPPDFFAAPQFYQGIVMQGGSVTGAVALVVTNIPSATSFTVNAKWQNHWVSLAHNATIVVSNLNVGQLPVLLTITNTGAFTATFPQFAAGNWEGGVVQSLPSGLSTFIITRPQTGVTNIYLRSASTGAGGSGGGSVSFGPNIIPSATAFTVDATYAVTCVALAHNATVLVSNLSMGQVDCRLIVTNTGAFTMTFPQFGVGNWEDGIVPAIPPNKTATIIFSRPTSVVTNVLMRGQDASLAVVAPSTMGTNAAGSIITITNLIALQTNGVAAGNFSTLNVVGSTGAVSGTTATIEVTSGGGGSGSNFATVTITNTLRVLPLEVIASTTNTFLDLALANNFNVLMQTNTTLVFTNPSAGIVAGEITINQDTNGNRVLDRVLVAGGILKTNANWGLTTNANAVDWFEFKTHLATNVVLTTGGNNPASFTTNDFVLNTYYTNEYRLSWVSAVIGMTNILAGDVSRVALYLDQNSDGTWEKTGIACRLNGVALLAGSEELSAFIAPSGRFMFTNLSAGVTPAVSIEANSSQWVKQ